MSITVINSLDHELVRRVTEQASARARAAEAAAEAAEFSSVLAENTQAVSSDSTGEASASSTGTSYSEEDLDAIFQEAANTYGVSAVILKSIAKAESGFNPSAVSSAGAVGIMQLMPQTAASLGVTNSYDARENIMGGAKYISQLLSKYEGNISLALAAYNAGSGNVEKYGGIPPFTETQNYVQKVLSYMEDFGASASSDTSSVFGLSGDARTQANQLLEEFFSSKNISKDALDLLVTVLKLKSLVSSVESDASASSAGDTSSTEDASSIQDGDEADGTSKTIRVVVAEHTPESGSLIDEIGELSPRTPNDNEAGDTAAAI